MVNRLIRFCLLFLLGVNVLLKAEDINIEQVMDEAYDDNLGMFVAWPYVSKIKDQENCYSGCVVMRIMNGETHKTCGYALKIFKDQDRDKLIKHIINAVKHDDWSGWDYAEIERTNTGKLYLCHRLNKEHESIVVVSRFEVKLDKNGASVHSEQNEDEESLKLFCVVP